MAIHGTVQQFVEHGIFCNILVSGTGELQKDRRDITLMEGVAFPCIILNIAMDDIQRSGSNPFSSYSIEKGAWVQSIGTGSGLHSMGTDSGLHSMGTGSGVQSIGTG